MFIESVGGAEEVKDPQAELLGETKNQELIKEFLHDDDTEDETTLYNMKACVGSWRLKVMSKEFKS